MHRRKFLRQTSISSFGLMMMPGTLWKSRPGEVPKGPIDVRSSGSMLEHYWSFCVGAGRANEGLRSSWMEQMAFSKENCGFRYCRFHGLFHDDMFVYREEGGTPHYNWQYIDDLFDRMLAIGVKPFVELSFMPKDLSATPNTVFWWKGHGTPPNDYQKWADLVEAFTRHCVDRYGMSEVKTWYFEVWNEPDLHGFWDGSKSEYFRLYKVSVQAVKKVDPELRVGGPSTSNFVPDGRFDGEREDVSKHITLTVKDINALEWKGVWIEDFLNYCKKEKLPVDFISTHPYPTDWAIDPETRHGAGKVREVGATKKDLLWLKKVIASSAYPKAEVHLTEWSSSPSPRDPTHDSLQAAAYIIKINIDCLGLADSMSYWTFTDVFEEKGAGDTIFHGGFGLINLQGIVKPAFHAYRMLNRLGDTVLHQEEGMVISRHSTSGKVTTLLYHYPAELKDAVGGDVIKVLRTGQPKRFSCTLIHLKPGCQLMMETLDEQDGYYLPSWIKMGKPSFPTRSQTQTLRAAALKLKKEKVSADQGGKFRFERVLAPWTCILIDQI